MVKVKLIQFFPSVFKLTHVLNYLFLYAGPPESVVSCSLTNMTGDHLGVRCDPGRSISTSQSFIMEVYDGDHLVTTLTSTDHPTFVSDGLFPNITYTLVVYAENQKGRSPKVVIMGNTEHNQTHHRLSTTIIKSGGTSESSSAAGGSSHTIGPITGESERSSAAAGGTNSHAMGPITLDDRPGKASPIHYTHQVTN